MEQRSAFHHSGHRDKKSEAIPNGTYYLSA
jgi:hypothetical protein